MTYPAGLSTATVELYLATAGGKPASGQYRVECDRAFGFTGTSWVMQPVTKSNTLLSAGWLRIVLPHTDQPGLTGDNGTALDGEPAYQFLVMPTNAAAFGYLTTVHLPMALGTGTVALSNLIDLGGWPTRTVTVAPPSTGTTYVPVTVGGSSGYWSPA